MKRTDCVTGSVAVLAVLFGVLATFFDQIPEDIEDLGLQMMILKTRAQFGIGGGMCTSRGSVGYPVSCRHRTFEDIFELGKQKNKIILKEQGIQALVDAVNKHCNIIESRTNYKAKIRYPLIDRFDTSVLISDYIRERCDLMHSSDPIQISVTLPPSIKRGTFSFARIDDNHDMKTSSSFVIVFFHAGGFSFHSSHWASEFRSRIAQEMNVSVISVNYTLSLNEPSLLHPSEVPSFLREGLAVLMWLNEQHKVPWSKMIIMGDSAGGGIAVSLARFVKEQTGESIKQCVSLSPWTEVCEFPESRSSFTNADSDPMLAWELSQIVGRLGFLARQPHCKEYAIPNGSLIKITEECDAMVKAGCENEYWNPLRLADFTGLNTKFLFQAAEGEILRDDAKLMHEKLVNSGVSSELILSPTNLHVLPSISPTMPESKVILEEIFAWMKRNLHD